MTLSSLLLPLSLAGLQSLHSFFTNYLPWYHWPEPWGLIPLAIHREILNHENLFPAPGVEVPALSKFVYNLQEENGFGPEPPTFRPDDGYGVDVKHPASGARGSAFSRNCPAIAKEERLTDDEDPPVQLVAQKLLARRSEDEFYPAGMQLNVLAAVWIQAMVHDWVGHFDDLGPEGEVRLEDGKQFGCPLDSFSFHRTLERPHDDYYNSFRTHWWDASWLYGQSRSAVEHTRAFKAGKVRVSESFPNTKVGTRSEETGGYYNTTGDNMNSWMGVSLLQEIFLKEHNAVAEAIVENHPELADDDDKVFGMARLTVSALLAKIHTIDWTVELLKIHTLKVGMFTNWYGLPKAIGIGDLIRTITPDFMKKTGNSTLADDKGVPFSLTEEFTAVYRLHPLLPDNLIIHLDGTDNGPTLKVPMDELFGESGERAVRADPKRPLQFWDSILRYPCGNLQLHNFPRSLRNIHPTDELGRTIPHPIDLAAVDLYRDRERGILRFNDFRRSLKLPPFESFYELTGGDETLTAELEEVYGVDGIERCELQVGRFAEKKLVPGFALSETSFVIFLLMATRRLEADPFLHEYYTEENYSPTGLHWIENTGTMREVLARHYPELVKDIPEDQSAFTPRTPWPGQSTVRSKPDS